MFLLAESPASPLSHSPSRTRKRRREKGPQLSLPSPQVRQFSEAGQRRKRRCVTDDNIPQINLAVSTPISDVIRINGWITAHHRRAKRAHQVGGLGGRPGRCRRVHAVFMKVSGAVSLVAPSSARRSDVPSAAQCG